MKNVVANVVEKMQQMGFSPRFVEDIAVSKVLNANLTYSGSRINAQVEVDDDNLVKKTKCTAYLCNTIISYFKKFDGTELIRDCQSFSIYREKRYNKNVFLLVNQKQIRSKFACESEPVILQSKLNIKGYDADVLFLSFLDEKETIAIISVAELLYVVGVPFAITAVDSDKVTLQCELDANVSIEPIENARTSFFLAFSF
jgi:hypothetical protein